MTRGGVAADVIILFFNVYLFIFVYKIYILKKKTQKKNSLASFLLRPVWWLASVILTEIRVRLVGPGAAAVDNGDQPERQPMITSEKVLQDQVSVLEHGRRRQQEQLWQRIAELEDRAVALQVFFSFLFFLSSDVIQIT